MPTLLCINAWYGRSETEVEIVKETAKRYLIRGLTDGTLIPGGRRLNKGGEIYVPKYAIKFVDTAITKAPEYRAMDRAQMLIEDADRYTEDP